MASSQQIVVIVMMMTVVIFFDFPAEIILLWPPRGQLKLCHNSTIVCSLLLAKNIPPPPLIKITAVIFQADLGSRKDALGRWNRVRRGRKQEVRAG